MHNPWLKRSLVAGLLTAAAAAPAFAQLAVRSPSAPSPDPRVGLKAGLHDAGQATWNMRLLANAPQPADFAGQTNSDLAFTGKYAIQGNYHGWQIWDISNPARPQLTTSFVCPASQSDVSVYKNLLFISGEGLTGRLDCGTQGVQERVSRDRLRGLRIFDISDIRNPRNVGNVQTCRGSHTHTVVEDPRDAENVYVYISGSAGIRSEEELPGCSGGSLSENPNTAEFRIEVIKVPVRNPSAAAIVSSPRIFNDLQAPPEHGEAPEDVAAAEREAAAARARGAYTARVFGLERVIGPRFVAPLLDSIMKSRGGTGTPTAADSATLRRELQGILDRRFSEGPRTGPTQCHDITVYPAIGLAGGACEGYGLLLDIRNPANPVRLDAAADSNFAYWHSATFNNDGTKVLFSDEWGGGGQAKCRATDRPEWGANAIFTIEGGRRMRHQSYYKLPAAQTTAENCVAHNGSLIPVPGRDIMVQSWYQGGVSVFDWTNAARPMEIAFFDRGPVNANEIANGGTWSAYWYNGAIYSSEMARGLDVLELTPSAHLTQNEIDAAKSVRLEYKNAQGQPRYTWPPSFALARAYADQLERSGGLNATRLASVRQSLAAAERAQGAARRTALTTLAGRISSDAAASSDAAKVRMMADAVRQLAQAR
jgi:hypothetical protein